MTTIVSESNSTTGGADNKTGRLRPLWVLLALLLAALVYPLTPLSEWILCPFRWLTELRCPGCGMTRSVTSFVRGDWAASWGFHPAGPMLLLAMGIIGGLRISDYVAERKVLAGLRERCKSAVTPVSLVLIVLLVIFWVYRLYVDVA